VAGELVISETFPPKPGSTLDRRFLVQELLGSGGMGVVMAAEHLGLRELVAIKLLHPDLARSTDTVARFLAEARAAAQLESKHVVRVMEAGTLSSQVPYFVMEYLPGVDLDTLLGEGEPLPFEDVIDYSLQALEALAEAHRNGICHRNLKPANLFLTTRDDDSAFIKVLDFGISKLSGWEVTSDGVITRQGRILGSPLYMSPEQIQDANSVDARSDIWSLGAVMHELLTARPPFEGSNLPRLIRSIFHVPYEPPLELDLPDELVGILVRCLKKSRDERYPDVQALARAFQPLALTCSTQASIERILRARSSVPPRSSTPPPRAADAVTNELESTRRDSKGHVNEQFERDTLPSVPMTMPRRRLRWVAAGVGLVTLVVFAVALHASRQRRARTALTGAAPPSPPSASASSGVRRAPSPLPRSSR
jgi:serine/threonine protein kinase